MPAVAAAQAAANRNARKKRKNKINDEKRRSCQIEREREGLQPSFSVRGLMIEGQMNQYQMNKDGLTETTSSQGMVFARDGFDSDDRHDFYSRLAKRCKSQAQSETFNGFIIFIILVAGVLVGLQTYESLEKNETIGLIDDIVLYIFCYEVLIKIIAENRKPWRYFTGGDWNWNCFDFFIVFMSLPIWDWGNSIALLRLMRLMRVIKLVKKIPQLYMIVMGLIGGMKAIVYILILLFIIFYLYAIVGYYLFTPNDNFHFGNLFKGLITLWRIATFEDWTDIYYINYYGCDSDFDSGFYTKVLEEANNAGLIYCPTKDSSGAGWFAVLYFITFVFISALVMLSLFVGAVTMSMTESMEQLKEEKEQQHREKVLERAREKAQSANNSSKGPIALPDFGMKIGQRRSTSMEAVRGFFSFGRGSEIAVEDSPDSPSETKSRRKSTVSNLMGASSRLLLMNKKDEEDTLDLDDGELRHLKALVKAAIAGDASLVDRDDHSAEEASYGPLKKFYSNLAHKCFIVTESAVFNNFIIFVILVAGCMVGMSTFELERDTLDVLEKLDLIIFLIFCCEVILKTIAARFRPWHYFYHRGIQRWNTFDYIIVAGSLLPGTGSTLVILRLLRLLRVLKLLKAFPELQVIVEALLNGLGSISYIAVILFLVFYLFAIVGMILFQVNDPHHFGTLHVSLFTLFRCATLEDWTDIMYVNMFGCNKFGYIGLENLCKSPMAWGSVSAIYFILFTLIGGLVLMTLFIGVVTTSMEEASSEQREQQELAEAVEKLRISLDLGEDMIQVYKDIFGLIDLDGGGTIDEEELAIGFLSVGKMFSKDEIKEMVAEVDEDNSGEIDIAEFIGFMQVFIQKTKFYRTDDGRKERREAQLRKDAQKAAKKAGKKQEKHDMVARPVRMSLHDSAKVHPIVS